MEQDEAESRQRMPQWNWRRSQGYLRRFRNFQEGGPPGDRFEGARPAGRPMFGQGRFGAGAGFPGMGMGFRRFWLERRFPGLRARGGFADRPGNRFRNQGYGPSPTQRFSEKEVEQNEQENPPDTKKPVKVQPKATSRPKPSGARKKHKSS